jgi:hypothetical protein
MLLSRSFLHLSCPCLLRRQAKLLTSPSYPCLTDNVASWRIQVVHTCVPWAHTAPMYAFALLTTPWTIASDQFMSQDRCAVKKCAPVLTPTVQQPTSACAHSPLSRCSVTMCLALNTFHLAKGTLYNSFLFNWLIPAAAPCASPPYPYRKPQSSNVRLVQFFMPCN